MTDFENNEDTGTEIELWDNSKRARIVIIVFGILIFIMMLSVLVGYFELDMLKKIQKGAQVDDLTVAASDLRVGLVSLFFLIFQVISIVVFLNWFRRAYGNVHRLGSVIPKYKEEMAVWAWFIPIVSLFRPVQIMSETWNYTMEEINKYDPLFPKINGSYYIGAWWALFILSHFIGQYFIRVVFKTDTIKQLVDSSWASLISDMAKVPEGILVILIVMHIAKMERKLYEEVRKAGGQVLQK